MGSLIVVFLVSHILISIGITTAEEYCYNTGNFTTNSTYAKNRILILSSLASNVTAHDGFFINATIGQDPNKIYAAAICRRDTLPRDCSSCVNSTSQNLISKCPVQNEALSWGETCEVRYAKRSFFGVVEQNPVLPLCNVGKFQWDTGEFYQMWNRLMDQVVRKASMGSSTLKYATGEANLTSSNSIYALMQCTPDLSQSDCDYCLRKNVAQFKTICSGRGGGFVMRPNCIFRWDLYPFYLPMAGALSPSPLPPSLPLKENKILSEGRGGKAKWIAIGASVLAILGMALFGYMWRRKNVKKEEKGSSQEVQQLDLEGGKIGDGYLNEYFEGEKPVKSKELLLIRLEILLVATKHFSDDNKLGEGGFGPVYKGVLADGKEIAVKRLSRTSGQGLLEFKNEVILIARLQHRNLVRLLGCCLDGNETLLIYEYMPNKSLDFFLFDSSMSAQLDRAQLDWKRRLSIINGIARGILYLHEDSRLRIIHRDLKASNVLLDHEMNPKISDFGMARIFGGNQSEANTNRVVGTYGYMAPEYAMEGLFSVKSDVFSFGVLLLEIISGKKNNRFHLSEHGQSLLNFAWKLRCEGQGLELIDPVIVQSCVEAEVLKCFHIGLLCVQEDPADRPTMSFVVVMLGSDTVTLPQPTQPAFSVGRVVGSTTESSSNIKFRSVNEITLSTMSAR